MTPDFLTLFNTLEIRLKEKFDGEIYHKKFIPKKRLFLSVNHENASTFKKSAVMVVIFPENGALKSILIKRADYNGAHSGQISFPGGKMDHTDGDLLETAIRETHEETGIVVCKKDILGPLTPLTIPISNFMVMPYLCLLAQKPIYNNDSIEVNEIFEYWIDELLSDSAIQEVDIELNQLRLSVPAFILNSQVVWGATAMILNELRAILSTIYPRSTLDG